MHALLVLAALLAPPPTGSIAGRVTIESGGPRHVVVMLISGESRMSDNNRPVATAKTDDEGRYRFDGVAAGEYVILPAAPGWVGDLEWSNGVYGKAVSVGEGESVTGVDVGLTRGGVITGRVTDLDGRPVVGERVELATASGAENGRVYLFGNVVRSTDDRGVYRIYGVPPGRYLVSVGVAADEARPMSMRPSSVSYYPKTYYPAAASEDAATPVEVAAGGEARGIDLVVGRRAKTYRARGRVVDAETGKPIANARIGYGKVMTNPDNSEWFAAMMVAYKSDAKGEFTMENFQPGRYAAFVASGTDKPWPWYGDPVPFEIADADADGVEIRLRRGARLSGVVVLEGADDPALRAKLASMTVWAKTEGATSSGLRNPYSSSSEIGEGGAFEIGGVAPGSVSFGLGSWPRQKGFMMVRLERGTQQVGNIQVTAGDDVSDLRVVVGYGTGTIRGRVTAKEGELPANASAYVWLRRAGASTFAESTSADSRCRFLFDGLPPGDYDLQVDVSFKGGKMTRATKTVTVANGAETPVEIPVDLGDKGDGGER